jgi:hypothetical protein
MLAVAPHVAVLLRILMLVGSPVWLGIVLNAIYNVYDLWDTQDLVDMRNAIVALTTALADELVSDDSQSELQLIFILMSGRAAAVPWLPETLHEFLEFTVHCIEMGPIPMLTLIGKFLLVLGRCYSETDDLVPVVEMMIQRIHDFDVIPDFILLLFGFYELFDFPADDLHGEILLELSTMGAVGFIGLTADWSISVCLDILSVLWKRSTLNLPEGPDLTLIFLRARDMIEEELPFDIRHKATVLVLAMMESSIAQICNEMAPPEIIALSFELFSRLCLETGDVDEMRLAIRTFLSVSQWFGELEGGETLQSGCPRDALRDAVASWSEVNDEEISAHLGDLIQLYAGCLAEDSD